MRPHFFLLLLEDGAPSAGMSDEGWRVTRDESAGSLKTIPMPVSRLSRCHCSSLHLLIQSAWIIDPWSDWGLINWILWPSTKSWGPSGAVRGAEIADGNFAIGPFSGVNLTILNPNGLSVLLSAFILSTSSLLQSPSILSSSPKKHIFIYHQNNPNF